MSVRISDADRDEAVEALTQHRVAGRMDEATFLRRVEQALAAEDETQLRGLFADLPVPWPEVALSSRKIEAPGTHPAVSVFTDLAAKAAEKVVGAVESFTGMQVGRRLPYPQVISPLHNRIRLSDLAIAATVDHHDKVGPTFPVPVEAVQKALINEGLLDAGAIEFGRWDDATAEGYRAGMSALAQWEAIRPGLPTRSACRASASATASPSTRPAERRRRRPLRSGWPAPRPRPGPPAPA
ncbi:DUF1707 domain-containing protein [Tessaracoccus sp. HDW20]|uniref:DUF1707 SHOCT-like domain-containing protein n=1 Tax=Tessaracoccus coleopterorum TaxID=2714950 RepID=UPI0018D396A9|nr:DUF1707 domain-containing protein [Tessaracoccus coleopterorum]